MPEGEEKEQEIGTLFEKKMMKENFPNLVKEIDIQAQEAQRGSSKMNPKTPTPRCIIIKMPKVKDKKQILKAAREKSYLKGSSHKTISQFLKRNFAGYKGLGRNIKGLKSRTESQDCSTQQSYHLEWKGR